MTLDEDVKKVVKSDAGMVRMCSDLLDTLWQREEISINQVIIINFVIKN